MTARSVLIASLLLHGCTSSTLPVPAFDRDGGAFFDAPWPSDLRTAADGTPDLTDFPNPSGNPILDRYAALAEQHVGFGANSPIYVRFDRPLDLDLLPDPTASVQPGSPLLLLDVDPRSPRYGEATPLQWRFTERRTSHEPANLLAVAPVWGFPLRPATTYALVVTTAVAERAPAMRDLFSPRDPDHALFQPLREVLFLHGLSREDVAVATVFTVGDPLHELARVAEFIDANITAPPLDQPVATLRQNAYFNLYAGTYEGPVFQHGERPYITQGGGFQFRDDGQPIVHSWDTMRLAISTPPDLSQQPPNGWPVVISQHGTGGSYTSFASGDHALEEAAQYAMAGLAGLSIDQPLHGTRGQSDQTDLFTFNYLNPDSGRSNFRQGAADALYLAKLVHEHGGAFLTESGDTIRLDPDRIYFMGHSQGGLTGALALPFLGPYIDGAVLSGAGGGLSITLVERKDPLDIAAVLADLLDFDGHEEPGEFHPAIGLIQWLVDVTDPVNYAPYFYAERGAWPKQEPTPVLIFSGIEDAQTPYRTAETLAAAARAPWLAPGVTAPESQALAGLEPTWGPLRDNAPAYDGKVTAAFSQWEGASHWVVFWDGNAARLYREFLRTAALGEPTVDAFP